MYEIIDLNNVRFIFSRFKEIETASLGIFLGVGARYEKKRLKGIAHFLEHMLFKGTKNYSHRRIKREIEGRGGSLNAFTSQEITAYYAHFLNKNFKITLDILLDMVAAPALRPADIEKERNVILQEIKMYNDLPACRALTLLEELIWPGHALGEEIIGSSASVGRIGRRDLFNFRNNHYVNKSMVISLSGNFPKAGIIDLLTGRIKSSKNPTGVVLKKPSGLRGLHIITEKKKLEQVHLCLGFRSPSSLSSKRIATGLLHIILGANMSSRLFEELREKRSLCYDVSTEARKYKDSGVFIIHLGLQRDKITLAHNTIVKELIRLKTKLIGAKELTRAKDYSLGHIAMSLERPEGRMFYAAESYLTRGAIESFSGIKESISRVSAEDLRILAKEIFNFKNMAISCVGNIDDNLDETLRKAAGRFKNE